MVLARKWVGVKLHGLQPRAENEGVQYLETFKLETTRKKDSSQFGEIDGSHGSARAACG